jgi:hypothetical protein
MWPCGFDATSCERAADGVPHPLGRQGAADRDPNAEKDLAMINRRSTSLQIGY